MKEFEWAQNPFETSRWYKMDVHDECFQELGRLIADARKQKERDYDKLLKNINTFSELINKS